MAEYLDREAAYREADRIRHEGPWGAEPVPNGDGTWSVRLTTRSILGHDRYFRTIGTVQEARYYRRPERP